MKPSIFWLAGLILSGPLAQANDTSVGLDSGNIIFKKSDGIAMRSEDLYISPKQVKVRYEFANETSADIKTWVGFPIPPFESEPLGDVNYPPDSPDPLGFSTWVDGKKIPVKIQRKVKDGQVELTYFWEQAFPAGKILVVEHRYQTRPTVGFFSAGEELAKAYCLEPALQSRIEAKHKAKEFWGMQEVGYILTTANNWKGPIGRFRLVLDKLKPDTLVSLCGEGISKTSPTRFEMLKQDFRPQQDLAILFIPAEH